MELINIVIIITCITICLIWAKRKQDEITKHAIELSNEEEQQSLYYNDEDKTMAVANDNDKEDLDEIGNLFNAAVRAMLLKIIKISG